MIMYLEIIVTVLVEHNDLKNKTILTLLQDIMSFHSKNHRENHLQKIKDRGNKENHYHLVQLTMIHAYHNHRAPLVLVSNQDFNKI
mmetsp:Transcript_25509/g.4241  ORF Transcript_25509/g.4241 Transcript_25509/m.4241 type:complete len:86 (-) Transcript_25509:1839-2096(-)